MRLLVGSLFALAVAALVGLGTTWLALTRGTAFGSVAIGAWSSWPKSGTRDVDPYSRAAIARSGELPVGSGDGVAFLAELHGLLPGVRVAMLTGTADTAAIRAAGADAIVPKPFDPAVLVATVEGLAAGASQVG